MNKFIPKDYKYPKIHKKLKYTTKKEFKHIDLKVGTIGLKCLESGRISSIILEDIRLSLSRKIKKIGKFIIFCHANKPLTQKSTGVRMGKGAGSLKSWVCVIKKGKVIIELKNIPHNLAYIALKSVSHKLPMKCKIITK